MLLFKVFSSPNEGRIKKTTGLPLTAIAVVVGLGLAVSILGIQANAKDKPQHTHGQLATLTPEQRETMAAALEKKAKCLRSPDKSLSDCHEEMKASCDGGKACAAQHETGSGKCPMMEETK